jgi:hypothetical protein
LENSILKIKRRKRVNRKRGVKNDYVKDDRLLTDDYSNKPFSLAWYSSRNRIRKYDWARIDGKWNYYTSEEIASIVGCPILYVHFRRCIKNQPAGPRKPYNTSRLKTPHVDALVDYLLKNGKKRMSEIAAAFPFRRRNNTEKIVLRARRRKRVKKIGMYYAAIVTPEIAAAKRRRKESERARNAWMRHLSRLSRKAAKKAETFQKRKGKRYVVKRTFQVDRAMSSKLVYGRDAAFIRNYNSIVEYCIENDIEPSQIRGFSIKYPDRQYKEGITVKWLASLTR